jgi:hypothetical protein
MKTLFETQKYPILFFDTYIISTNDKGGLHKLNHMEKALSTYRDKFSTYRWEKKIDIVKYTLCSYAKIKWDKVVIRFECEDENETESFHLFCKDLFPHALIENKRSATAKQYFESLSLLDNGKNPWIYLSSNNDHPYLGDPEFLPICLDVANKLETRYDNKDLCILYSHFTESMIDNKITEPQWGYFESNFKKIIYEDENVIATVSNKLTLDSIKIFRLDYLLNLFIKSKNKGRLIRTEDTGFHLNYSKSLITIAPKIELCRHYDSYAHLMKWVPPLFIPVGFFDFNIKIRYGYENNIKGWVSVNPNKDEISNEIDLCCLLEDLPFFWKDRISTIDINPAFELKGSKQELIYYKNLLNPFHSRKKLINIFRSIFVWLGQISPRRNSSIIILFLSSIKTIGIYKPLQKVWRLKKYFKNF